MHRAILYGGSSTVVASQVRRLQRQTLHKFVAMLDLLDFEIPEPMLLLRLQLHLAGVLTILVLEVMDLPSVTRWHLLLACWRRLLHLVGSP